MPLTKKKIPAAERKLLKVLTDVLDERKAGELVVMDVREQSSITDFFIIATATSDPHLRAMRNELDRSLKKHKVHLVGVDAEAGSGWTVIDAFDVMVHLFTSETRQHYRLESLWKDAPVVGLEDLKTPTRKKTASAAKKTASAAKKTAVRKAPARKKKP